MPAIDRQRQFKIRMTEDGFVQCNIWVPVEAVPEFRRAADLAREDRNLTVGRMVNRRTGRMRSLK